MISLLAILKTGEAIEIAAIGREGAVGTKFGARPQLSFARAVVQLAGTALRIDISQFHQAAIKSSAIADLAMSANDVLVANLQQSAACNAIHGLEARLAGGYFMRAIDTIPIPSLSLRNFYRKCSVYGEPQ